MQTKHSFSFEFLYSDSKFAIDKDANIDFGNIFKYFHGGGMENQMDQMVSIRDVDDWKNESFEYH